MKKYLLCILLTVVSIHSYSTCIVILKMNNIIYVAADSRSNVYNILNPNSTVLATSICKIHSTKNVFFAVSGHGDQTLTSEASKSLTKNKNVKLAIIDFCKKMKLVYQNIMNREKISNPKNYDYYLHNSLAGVSFFGFENGKAYITTAIISMGEKKSNPNNPSETIITYAIGEHQSQANLGISAEIKSLSDDQMRILFDPSKSPV